MQSNGRSFLPATTAQFRKANHASSWSVASYRKPGSNPVVLNFHVLPLPPGVLVRHYPTKKIRHARMPAHPYKKKKKCRQKHLLQGSYITIVDLFRILFLLGSKSVVQLCHVLVRGYQYCTTRTPAPRCGKATCAVCISPSITLRHMRPHSRRHPRRCVDRTSSKQCVQYQLSS
jgi:hypothetical protein